MDTQPVTIFTYINTINNKEGLFPDDDIDTFDSIYSQYVVNMAYCRYPDTIMLVEKLVIMNNISNKQHFEYLYNTVPKKKGRYPKWNKPDVNSYIAVIMEVYKYSNEKAKSVIDLFVTEDLENMKLNYLNYGGVKK